MNPKVKLSYKKTAEMKYEDVGEVCCVTPRRTHREHRGQDPISLRRLVSKKSRPVPRWVKKVFHKRGLGFEMTHGSWRDHIGYCGDVLISEPYGLGSGRVRDLVEFCDKHGLDFEIDACSQHFPTQTLAIFVWPKEQEKVKHDKTT